MLCKRIGIFHFDNGNYAQILVREILWVVTWYGPEKTGALVPQECVLLEEESPEVGFHYQNLPNSSSFAQRSRNDTHMGRPSLVQVGMAPNENSFDCVTITHGQCDGGPRMRCPDVCPKVLDVPDALTSVVQLHLPNPIYTIEPIVGAAPIFGATSISPELMSRIWRMPLGWSFSWHTRLPVRLVSDFHKVATALSRLQIAILFQLQWICSCHGY